MGERIVVDTDLSANFDDAFALALAVVSPELRSRGHHDWFYPKESAALARRIMDHMGSADQNRGGDSPRYKQANRPLNLFSRCLKP